MNKAKSRNFAVAALLLSGTLLNPLPPAFGQATPATPATPQAPRTDGRSFQERLQAMVERPQSGSGGGGLGPGMGGESWPAPAWTDTGIVLTNVSFQNLPLSEVVGFLRQRFNQGFDVILPQNYRAAPGERPVSDANAVGITLTLKNAGAEDVFNAMNTYFEINGTALHWELSLPNGRRLAVLRPTLPGAAPGPAESQHMIFFVGDLLGNGKSGGMTIVEVAKTVTDVHNMSFPNASPDTVISCYREGELIVATGSPAELQVVSDTIRALRDKIRWDVARNQPSPPPQPGAPPKTP